LVVPVVQKHFVFLHAINFPFFADFDTPEKYGLAPAKTRNLRLEGADGNYLGAWHVLPDAVYRSQVPSLIPTTSLSPEDSVEADEEVIGTGIEAGVYDRALCTHPTVIYLHGNAANRAAPFRIAAYAQLSSRLQANVLAIDYRGFGDSHGTPSEEGLVADARLAWDWVQRRRQACKRSPSSEGGREQTTEDKETRRASPDVLTRSAGKDILVMGQSLGTGPATALTLQLAREGTPPQGLVLLAPYRSFSQLAAGFRIGGFLPVLLPALYLIPFAQAGLELALRTRFDSEGALAGLVTAIQEGRTRLHAVGEASQGALNGESQAFSWPHVVISHAINDEVIPYSHGRAIFDKMLKTEVEIRQSRRSTNLQTPTLNHPAGSGSSTQEQIPLPDADENPPAKLRIQDIQLSWASVHRFFACSLAREGQRPLSTANEKDDKDLPCPSVALLLPTRGGHNTVSEGIVDLIGELTQVRGKPHVAKAEKPWLPAVRRDRHLSYVSEDVLGEESPLY
jgi:abhydrolase domain-containing protein 12